MITQTTTTQAALPLLYTYRRCPYAMRARMALLQAQVRFEACEIVLRDKPAAMLAVSPKGTVPVLVLTGGLVLEQSWDIVRWAFEHTGDVGAWWARAQTPINLTLQAACDGPFKHHLDRTKYPERFTDAQGRDWHREQALQTLLLPLDEQLRTAPQLGGNEPCAADIGIFPFVRQFAATDAAWWAAQALPAVQAWLARWLISPLFEAAMRKPL
ncbi:glutathione S-transferase N-terminal domain-containing protein [Limnohabitans sp. DM1]|uniref:glutathione S-transferase N-terminal domain-containing protein n=1 Tax=Limnohabitans sp. DM1 TaxID=1597955 RepID=UPI000B16EB84|nr:glutathione S-transferase N-terminal domain-containing protein [Limnohabitans sp. DM1]